MAPAGSLAESGHQDQRGAQLVRSVARGGGPALQQLGHVVESVGDRAEVHGGDRLCLVLERGHDTEVPGAPAEGPEQVGILRGRCADDVARGGDDLGCEQAVDGQAVLADHPADPAGLGQPRHADRGRVARGDRETVLRHRLRGRTPGGAGADAHAPVAEHLDLVDPGQVENDSVVDVAVPERVVTSVADGQRKALVAGMPQRRSHLLRRRRAQDDGWFGRAGDGGPCLVVVRIAGSDRDVFDGHAGRASSMSLCLMSG